MKKLIFTLTILFSVCLSVSVYGAYASDWIRTDVFSPETYLEFCDLSSPIDYSYDSSSDTHVIAEAKRLIIYRDGKFDYVELSDFNITKIKFFNADYLLFLSDGKLYSLNLNTKTISDSTIVANYFDVNNNLLVLSVGNSFKAISVSVSDDISFTEKSHYNVERNYTAITIISDVEWLCVYEGTLFKFNSNGNGNFVTVTNNLKDTRHATYFGGYYYLTRPSGLYSVKVATGETVLLKGSKSAHLLGNVISPQGVSCYNGKLYVADYSLNAVSEFDPETKTFTGFYITSRSDGSCRVSAMTSDLQCSDGAVYALDKNVVKIFKDGKNSYKTLPLSGAFSAFSVIGQKMLVTNGSAIYAVNLEDEAKAPSLITIGANLSAFTNVTAITSFAENFYFINNTTIESNPYVEVYSISSRDFKKAEKIASVQGRGDDICADIFGKLYIRISKNSISSVVSFNEGDAEVKELFTVAESDKINSIICDFECNVYALLGNNKIARIDNDLGVKYYTLTLSDNLPAYSTAKDLTIIPATDKIYALFDGFILSLNPSDFEVSSPMRMKKPNAVLNNYNSDFKICSLKAKTRYFEVSLSDKESEYFDYTGYSTYTGDKNFAVIYEDDKYTLVANDELSCVVRTSDVTEINLDRTEKPETMFYVVNGYCYGYPVLTEYFRNASTARNQNVRVSDTFTFNSVKFATINYGETTGYVPYSMLKTGVAITDTSLDFGTYTVSRTGAKVYADSAMTEVIGSLDAFAEIKVYKTENGVALIDYDGKVAYIQASTVRPKGLTVVRNLALITLVLIAVIVTVTFVYKRKYSRRNGN